MKKQILKLTELAKLYKTLTTYEKGFNELRGDTFNSHRIHVYCDNNNYSIFFHTIEIKLYRDSIEMPLDCDKESLAYIYEDCKEFYDNFKNK